MRCSFISGHTLFLRSGKQSGLRKFLWWLLEGREKIQAVAGEAVRMTENDGRITKTWHLWRDWSFTPFVVVVGSKYFLPAPECLLFDRATIGSRRWLSPIPPRRVWGGFDAWPQ